MVHAGFVKDDDYEKWPALIGHIRDGRCTPVLGLGLTDSIFGSRQDIARKWAQRYRYPLSDHDRDDLPQVAQYVSTNQDDAHVRRELGDYLRTELVERYPEFAPANLGVGTLPVMLRDVWQGRREKNPDDPFAVLARLPFPMYVTTHTSTLLEDALRAEGRWDDDNPTVAYCEWKDIDWPESIYEREPEYEPTPERPLVVYLMGNVETPSPQNPTSLVITENDYFNYLIEVSRNPTRSRATCAARSVNGSLMFLGFRLEDWDFRVLFRTIMRQPGAERRDGFDHVAAQIDPETGETVDPARARRYLERYLQTDRVSVFWGTVDDFAGRLRRAWDERTR